MDVESLSVETRVSDNLGKVQERFTSNSVFSDIRPCIPLNVNRLFGVICCLHFEGLRRAKQETSMAHVANIPDYLLVMTYTIVELLLHSTEHFLRGVYLGFFLSVSLSARVLRWCVGFLSDIQEVRSQFLQLTARYGHYWGIQAKGIGKC
jgi:hypothetical protein